MPATKMDRLSELARAKGIFRLRELDDHDIPHKYVYRLADRGELVRLARGVYQHTSHEVTAQHTLAVAAKRVPHGVICLVSALRFHELTSQNPHKIWMAIGQNDATPTTAHLALRVVRMSGEARTGGIEQHTLENVSVQVYSPAKTVADCFKFRSTVGLDVAIEALRDYVRQGRPMDEVWRFAGVCRVQTVMRPYMEAVA
ncbi:MAG: transcriptional regulator [Bacteroidetes bacterium]|jgi:predicted transcriptional regulator of viral defense system|nr:transcriptional regulator [Bacteroidota bacterium]